MSYKDYLQEALIPNLKDQITGQIEDILIDELDVVENEKGRYGIEGIMQASERIYEQIISNILKNLKR